MSPGNHTCHVAVSTLASIDLAEKLARVNPEPLCIVGKTETENIGIEKIIRNTISNPSIHFLILAGKESEGHRSGGTMRALFAGGVDARMRVIGAPGKKPVLKNLTREEVEAFRNQVHLIDMMGSEDVSAISAKMVELLSGPEPACHNPSFAANITSPVSRHSVETIEAEEPGEVRLDRSGYFVIIPEPEKERIIVEHYAYDNRLLRVIQGKTARSLYHTIVKKKWVSTLTHAAYLGKELARAETALTHSLPYVQDGA